MQSLFETVREEATAQVWSRGVELARLESVSAERESEDEVVLRVTTRAGLIAPTVTLYPDDDAWECSCNGQEDPCEHVTAAVIALRQAKKKGESLRGAGEATSHVRYAFSRVPGGLALARELVAGDTAVPLVGSLRNIGTQNLAGPRFAATPADLDVDKLVTPRPDAVPPGLVPRLLAALERCPDVTLDGAPVRTGREPVRPHVVLRDAPEGFLLKLEPEESLAETFPNAIARCGDTLRPVGTSGLDGRERESLPRGRVIPFDQAAMLVTELLPSLQERIDVDVQTTRLPDTSRQKPRIAIETRRDGDRLSLLATLVYGDPPNARIDAGRLVHLQGAVPIRDRAEEARLQEDLRSELGLTPGHRVDLGAHAAVAWVERLADFDAEVRGDAHAEFRERGTLEAALSIGDDGTFAVDFSLEGEGGGRAEADAVLRAWRDREPLVRLLDGGFARLPADWLARFGTQVSDLLAARGERDVLPACALPDLAALCEDLDHPPPPALERLRPLLHDFEGLPEATLPSDLAATLRGYQKRGVDWLCFLRSAGLGALLADDMGLGKTLQSLCALDGRTLIVAPTSVLHGWVDELQRFRPAVRFCLYHGARRTLDPEADVVITSYALLRLDADVLQSVEWDGVVLDEAQNIKNPESQVARVAYGLRAHHRVALSGTPVENRLDELWSQFHFLNPGLLGGRSDFAERYAQPIAAGDAEAAARLRARIRPFVLRRLKTEVATELPPRSEVVLHCELGEDERAVYEGVRAASVPDVVRRLRAGGGVMQALEALLRLRQAACHSGLVPGQHAERSTKVDLLVDRLEQVTGAGHKGLVFSQWTALLDRIEPELERANVPFTRLDGSTRDRGAVVEAFQREDGPPVMLVSLKAGGTGLNLTAADHVFLLDPWWNPAVEDQAADRAHRIGQRRAVVVHRLVAEDTVEERILELQKKKRALADAALGESEQTADLGRDDLLALLE